MARPPVIVTRPASAGQRLHQRLRTEGWLSLWLPAFDIGTAPDSTALRHGLDNLAAYQLVVFVSPHAVSAAAPFIQSSWPVATVLGVVGRATEQAAIAEIPGATDAVRVAPHANDESGSEGLWSAWRESGRRAERVLVIRAQGGRDWLIETFAQAGTTVDVLAAYTRTNHALGQAEQNQIQRLLGEGPSPVIVFSSSEAVAALDEQLSSIGNTFRWLRDGTAMATHPRIAERLSAAGYDRVVTTEADDSSVLAKLESLTFAS